MKRHIIIAQKILFVKYLPNSKREYSGCRSEAYIFKAFYATYNLKEIRGSGHSGGAHCRWLLSFN